jgi:hypothetical protein
MKKLDLNITDFEYLRELEFGILKMNKYKLFSKRKINQEIISK